MIIFSHHNSERNSAMYTFTDSSGERYEVPEHSAEWYADNYSEGEEE
jgi:hypothetical protein